MYFNVDHNFFYHFAKYFTTICIVNHSFARMISLINIKETTDGCSGRDR